MADEGYAEFTRSVLRLEQLRARRMVWAEGDGHCRDYLLRSIIIPTWVSALALARWGRALAEPYQFRNAWPGRFKQGNIGQ